MKNFINFLPPWVETNCQPAFYDVESGTVLQQTARMYAKINQLIRNFNELAERFSNIENYFENLDVQEEINNKLDEMAENGELNEIINNYDKAHFIFPKNWKNISSSDANLIINQGKSLMVDVSYSDCYSKVVDMLNDNGVTHLDYVVITHWDNDHIGNLKSLITNDIIDSDTDVYMPLATSYTNPATVADYQAFFAEHNIDYKTPTNLATINVGNVKVTFGNCDLAQDEQYAGIADARNLMSTVLLIEHKDVKAFYSGDADNQAYEYLYRTGFVKGAVDLFKIGHHGFNVNTYAPFLKLCSPKYAVQPASGRDFNEGDFAFSPSINTIVEQGGKVYPTYMNEDYLHFESDGYDIHVVNGNPLGASQYIEDNTDIYVDVNTVEPDGDGSSDKPYKDIGAAFGSVNNYNTRVVTIRLADGSYGFSGGQAPAGRKTSVWIDNAKPAVRIVGDTSHPEDVVLNGCRFSNSTVTIEGVTINCKYRHGVACYNGSVISLNHCVLSSDEASTYNGITAVASTVSVENCEIDNVTNGIDAGNGSSVGISGLVFGTISSVKMASDYTSHYIANDVTNKDSSPNLSEFTNYNKTMLLYRGDGSIASDYTISSIDLPVDFSELTSLEITLKSNTNRYLSSGKIYYPQNGMVIPMELSMGSATYTYKIFTEVALSDDNKLTMQGQMKIQTKRSDGSVVYTDYPSGGNYYFKFINVRGQRDRFNVLVGENE